MSRFDLVEIEVVGVSAKELADLMTTHFWWEEIQSGMHQGVATFRGEGCYYGEESDEATHAAIVTEVKKINPVALVRTRWPRPDWWAWSDGSPCPVYGDDLPERGGH